MLWFSRSKKSVSEPFRFTLAGFNNLGWHELSASQAWGYYKKVQPIYTSVNIISDEGAYNVKPFVYDVKNKEYYNIYDDKTGVLKLLSKPNTNVSYGEFMKALINSFIVTGNVYILFMRIGKRITAMYYVNPNAVEIHEEQGQISYYKLRNNTIYSPNDRGEFVDSSGNILLHIRNFSPDDTLYQINGFSPLNAVYYEIEQTIHTNKHNLSNLQKGARPSGALIIKKELDKEERESIRRQLQAFYQGTDNAGNVFLLEGDADKEFKELSLSNKDMDFLELKKIVSKAIYDILRIPSSFYDNTTSTYNNKETDKYNLYDFAILPIIKLLYDKLSSVLFKGNEQYMLSYDEDSIPALKDRNIDVVINKAKLGVLSYNEVRALIGYEDIGKEGDVIFAPINIQEIGTDKDTNNKKEIVDTLRELKLDKKDIERLSNWL